MTLICSRTGKRVSPWGTEQESSGGAHKDTERTPLRTHLVGRWRATQRRHAGGGQTVQVGHDNHRRLLEIDGEVVVLWKSQVPQETLVGAQRARQKLQEKVSTGLQKERKELKSHTTSTTLCSPGLRGMHPLSSAPFGNHLRRDTVTLHFCYALAASLHVSPVRHPHIAWPPRRLSPGDQAEQASWGQSTAPPPGFENWNQKPLISP